MKFADNLEKKIDMKKIQLELMKPFITGKLNAMMPIEDDVIIEYVYSQLEESQVDLGLCFICIYLFVFSLLILLCMYSFGETVGC